MEVAEEEKVGKGGNESRKEWLIVDRSRQKCKIEV